MTHPFSPAGRKAALVEMATQPVDLLIIGGGITGCGLARDAALRGLRVALVEKGDFASGTSSRSSKLIHGGLRYLAYGDFAMVKEAARERQVLRRIASHLVHPLTFVVPVWADQSLTKYRAGLWLFDHLAGTSARERHQVLGPGAVLARVPGLRQPLKGGLSYREYITDDARFTLEHALSAALHGALVANYAPVVRLLIRDGRIAGAEVEDALSGQRFLVRARVVINATGPWAARTLGLGELTPPKPLLPSKGIHLIFRADRLPIEGAVALTDPSGQAGFAIRRWDLVYVGTTDEPYTGSLDAVTADAGAVQQLMTFIQTCFPGLDLSYRDVIGTWAGVRPLIAEPGRAPRDTSRHDEVWQTADGLLTIAGGKLTTYRPMARRIMVHVARLLGWALGDDRRTAEVPLPGAWPEGADPDERAGALQSQLEQRGVSPAAARRVVWLYGARAHRFIRMGAEDPAWLAPLAPDVPSLRGEVLLAVTEEMALRLSDFLDRRSALLLFDPRHGEGALDEASRIMAALLGWSESHRQAEVADCRRLISDHAHPPYESANA
jgi:glycerol-3-phosphate dehydrogenase